MEQSNIDVLIVSSAAFNKNNYKRNVEWIESTFKGIGIKRAVLVGLVPRWNEALPQHLLKLSSKDSLFGRLDATLLVKRTNYGLDVERLEIDALMRDYLGNKKSWIEYFSSIDALCDDKGCLTLHPRSGSVLAYDQWHLTAAGSEMLADKLIQYTLKLEEIL